MGDLCEVIAHLKNETLATPPGCSGLILVLVRYSIYRSITILAKVRYRYLVVSRYFDIFGIERPLFDTFDT